MAGKDEYLRLNSLSDGLSIERRKQCFSLSNVLICIISALSFCAVSTMEFFADHFNNSCNFKQFFGKVKMDPVFKELNFNCLSVQSVPKRLSTF